MFFFNNILVEYGVPWGNGGSGGWVAALPLVPLLVLHLKQEER